MTTVCALDLFYNAWVSERLNRKKKRSVQSSNHIIANIVLTLVSGVTGACPCVLVRPAMTCAREFCLKEGISWIGPMNTSKHATKK